MFAIDRTTSPARTWANNMLTGSTLILDTETTGLDPAAQVIQIAIIDMRGDVMFDSLIRPSCAISHGAAAVHGMTMMMLRNAPTITEVLPVLRKILGTNAIVIYNAAFDVRILKQTCVAFGRDADWVWRLNTQCAMRMYAQLLGASKWTRLEGGDHTAVGDCQAVLALLKRMAKE